MKTTSKLATAAALAALSLSGFAASAQTVSPGDPQATTYKPYHVTGSRAYRPLTVKRRPSPEATIAAIPVPAPPETGPSVIITGPTRVAGSVVALPFQALGGVFPATGDIGANPLVLIGAPIHAAGQIAQFPFRMIEAAFGGAPYPAGPGLFQ